MRGADTVSRQGGDEFVVLLSELEQSEDAAHTARRMLQAVAEAHSIDQHDLHVTTSIGVSVYPDDGLDAETLIKNADTAMYQAKENGRQSYRFFKPAMNVRAVERQSIEESLRRALERRNSRCTTSPRSICGPERLPERKHCYAGRTPHMDWFLRPDLFRSRKTAASFCRSAPGSCVKRAARPEPGWMQAFP